MPCADQQSVQNRKRDAQILRRQYQHKEHLSLCHSVPVVSHFHRPFSASAQVSIHHVVLEKPEPLKIMRVSHT